MIEDHAGDHHLVGLRLLDERHQPFDDFRRAADKNALAAVTDALAIDRRFLPPTINQVDPDPDCDLDYIPNTGRPAEIDAALCNCLGFGSKNSAIVIGRI